MLNKVKEANDRFNLISSFDKITVALSGGADSVCLLYSLYSLKRELEIELSAAHFNHGIRGEEADRDEEFSRNLCKSLDIPFYSEKGDAISYAKQSGKSLETAARELRYDFLSRVSEGKIATAHTASDNIETMLFNLARGTSLDGIKGIPPKRDNIIRPLILCSREEIENYCRQNSLSFVTDSTNLSDDCSRNIIRHKIIPVLKEINQSSVYNASKLSVLLNEDSKYLLKTANDEFCRRYISGGLSVENIKDTDKAVFKRVLSLFVKKITGATADFYHIERLVDVCEGKIHATELPNGFSARLQGKRLVLSDKKPENTVFLTETEIISAEKFKSLKKIHELFLNNAVDYDKIVGKLKRIERNSNDTVKLANSNSTKTLKKLLTEKKISLCDRENLPIYADDMGIVWCFCIGTADRVKIDKNTKTVLYFKTEKIGENSNYGND